MKFLMPHSASLSSSSLVSIIFIAVLTLASISIANKFAYIRQHDRSHLAKALAPKYPEAGLPSSKGPTILDPNLKAELVFRGLRFPTRWPF
jgi:hypothetical protein